MKLKEINFLTIFKYSYLILLREWRKFILPFLSLTFTTAIVFTVLLFTTSSGNFLNDKNRELIGGDISLESNYELTGIQLDTILGDKLKVLRSTEQYNFSGILNRGDINTPVSISVVDEQYPIYGGLTIKDGVFITPKSNEIYIDTNAETKLNVKVGDEVVYANRAFTVRGIIEKDSKSLISGFSFLPKVLISKQGFEQTGIDKTFLRSEYTYLYLVNDQGNDLKNVISRAGDLKVKIDVAGVTKSGLTQGLSLVEQFLILAVLLSCILSAVNIYAGMLYFLTILRKSFAVLIAIGFDKKSLILTLSLSLLYVLIISAVFGGIASTLIFDAILGYVSVNYGLDLPSVSIIVPVILTLIITFSVSFSSFVPSLRSLLNLNPKMLLSGGQDGDEKTTFANFGFITLSTLIPLVLIAIFLLDSYLYGLLSIVIIISVYMVLALGFYYLIKYLYSKRDSFSFINRTLISYRHADGLFGVVSLTSLYVALTSLSLLILLQATLATFIKADLNATLPSMYIVDVQKSQIDTISKNFTDITLFPNVGARIVSIDGLDIQKGIALSDERVNRELGREYNLTYRPDLISSETVTKGTWLSGKINEVSVEGDFAERANIKLGSKVVFSISGFEVVSTVTSIRKSDTRSGLPFFYFVFNPNDLEKYPATFFGYTNINSSEKTKLTNFLAKNLPNVSTIDTAEITKFATGIIGGLLVIIFVISIPPLILALFLIITLVISSFSGRRKQSAQLLAIGSTRGFIEKLYYLEAISTTAIGSILGYISAVIATLLISKYYLKIKSTVFFDLELLIALGAIILFVLLVASVLWRSDKKPLRELLSYEER
jgi:putative ABC transport system permease protein